MEVGPRQIASACDVHVEACLRAELRNCSGNLRGCFRQSVVNVSNDHRSHIESCHHVEEAQRVGPPRHGDDARRAARQHVETCDGVASSLYEIEAGPSEPTAQATRFNHKRGCLSSASVGSPSGATHNRDNAFTPSTATISLQNFCPNSYCLSFMSKPMTLLKTLWR